MTPSCYICFLRQAESVCDLVGADAATRTRVLRAVCAVLSLVPDTVTPPEVSDGVHKAVRDTLGVADPYHELKREYNNKALERVPALEELCEASADPLAAYVRAALCGNIIDFGCATPFDLDATYAEMASWQLDGAVLARLRDDLGRARSLLFLTDNAGEIVFDALLLRHIRKTTGIERITVAVKGGPWINDAMEEDAAAAGIRAGDGITILRIGTGERGTGMMRTSPAFANVCETHDVIISKGQANWELLGDRPGMYFLLIAKCPLIASAFGTKPQSPVLHRSS